jgi:hypothetical protein
MRALRGGFAMNTTGSAEPVNSLRSAVLAVSGWTASMLLFRIGRALDLLPGRMADMRTQTGNSRQTAPA